MKGGRIVGSTDEMGLNVVDGGWSQKRSILMEDVATTIYSVMGIDWSKKIEGTPSGRAFYYIEPFASKKTVRNQEISAPFV